MARPKIPANERRTLKIEIPVNAEEYNTLKQEADVRGLPISVYIRDQIALARDTQREMAILQSEIHDLKVEIKKIK